MLKQIKKHWYFEKIRKNIHKYASLSSVEKVFFLETIKEWVIFLNGQEAQKKWMVAWFDLIQENMKQEDELNEENIKSSSLDLVFKEELSLQRMLSMKEVCIHLQKNNKEWGRVEHDLMQILRKYLFKNHVFLDEWGVVTYYCQWNKEKIPSQIQWNKIIVSKKIIQAINE